jgi:hypothetical protein
VSPSKQTLTVKVPPPSKQPKALIELRQVYKVDETAAGDFPALLKHRILPPLESQLGQKRSVDLRPQSGPDAGSTASISS